MGKPNGLVSLAAGARHLVVLLEWQVRLLLRCAPGSAIAAVALSGASVVLQGASAAVLLLFVRAQQSGGSARLLSIEVPARPTVGGLAAWSAVVLLLGATAAGLAAAGAERAQVAAAAGTRRYLSRVLAEASRLASVEPGSFPPRGRPALLRAFARDSAVLTRSLSLTLGLFMPGITAVLAAIVLAWLDLGLTLGVALPLALLALPYWVLSRGVLTAARSYEEIARRRTIRLREMLASALGGASLPAAPDELHRRLASDATLRDNERAIAAFMLRGDRVQALRIGYLGVALCGLLLLFGAFQGRDDSWAALATFVVALRYATSSLGTTAGTLAGAVRYIPQLERMREMDGARAGEDWRRLLETFRSAEDLDAAADDDELD
jgi:ABC-type multidrug transport system fused ATPase/permease subunit